MSVTKIVGIVLIVLGLVSFFFNGIPYRRETDSIKIGPVKVATEENKSIPVSPLVGGVAVVGGIILLLAGRKK